MTVDPTLARFADACKSAAAEYIERATRFGVSDLHALRESPAERRCTIKIRHALEVASEVKDYQGNLKPGDGDFSSADWAWYQEQVKEQAQAELRRPETLDSLAHAVRTQAYATIATKTCIRTHPRRLFHTYTCNGCHGSGYVRCDGCGGAGKVRCGPCYGSGRVNCSTCGGSGQVSEVRQVRDYNGYSRTEMQRRLCYSCSGGTISCYRCSGSGKNRCSTCGGSGVLTCGTCAGHGYLTRITTTQTYTVPHFSGIYPEHTPNYVHAALCKAGFANLEQHGAIKLHEANVIRDQAAVEFSYHCTMPFCELSIEVQGHKSEWVLYGNSPRIFDAGGVLEVLLQEDFDRLAALTKSKSRWLPWFHRSARKIVAPFMESEVHQEIVDASRQGMASKAIAERVNRSVSESYIQAALLHLATTVRIAAYWSRIKWVTALAMLSVPFVVAVQAFLQRSQQHLMFSGDQRLFLFPSSSTGISWEAGVITVPFTLLGWVVAKWISKRWIKRAGGSRAVQWAGGQNLLVGKWTGVAAIVAGVAMAGSFFSKWPIWIDRGGRAYGQFAVFQPPRIVDPVATKIGSLLKRRGDGKAKNKPKPMQ